jgi:hypothetical protein
VGQVLNVGGGGGYGGKRCGVGYGGKVTAKGRVIGVGSRGDPGGM